MHCKGPLTRGSKSPLQQATGEDAPEGSLTNHTQCVLSAGRLHVHQAAIPGGGGQFVHQLLGQVVDEAREALQAVCSTAAVTTAET